MPEERPDLQLLIERPAERPDVEYKGAMKFGLKDPDPHIKDFSHKLIKHILGHANAGGGYMVVGMKEDDSGALLLDEQMTAEVASTYESTRLSEMVNKKIKGNNPLALTVHTLDNAGHPVVVIEVEGFSTLPFFTDGEHRDANNKVVLKNHTLYVRSATTNTVEVCSPEDFEIVLRRALTLRNEDFLNRFRELTRMMGIHAAGSLQDTSTNVQAQKAELLRFASWGEEQAIEGTLVPETFLFSQRELWKRGHYHVAHTLLDPQPVWSYQALKEAMRRAELHRTGWPMGMVREPTTLREGRGIQDFIHSGQLMDFWLLKEDGSFYFQRILEEDENLKAEGERFLSWGMRVWRTAEALEHTQRLYHELGVPGTAKVLLQIGLHGLQGRVLRANERRLWPRSSQVCNKQYLVTTLEVTVDQLAVSLNPLVMEFSKEMFEEFGIWEVPAAGIEQEILEYKKRAP